MPLRQRTTWWEHYGPHTVLSSPRSSGASPTVAKFAHGGDVEGLARLYAEHGAAAISVVTDTERFGMSLDDVSVIRQAAQLPVLVKEFVVDRVQALAARAAGADDPAPDCAHRANSPSSQSCAVSSRRSWG